MDRVEEIKHALKWLRDDELNGVTDWLRERVDSETGSDAVAEPASASALRAPSYMTIDEYFELEEASQFKHEYINGVVYAMSGPTVAHARVTGELFIAFKARLRGGPCEAFATDVMLQIRSDTDEIIYRPDLVVACNREEWGKNYVCNPKLVVEVLSPSTEHIDRREKATTYRAVRSIEEYVLVEQDEYRVTAHRRADNWTPRVYSGGEAVVELPSISLAIPLKQIYAGTLQ
jgi:Uma2 family endonuclease